MLRPLLWTVNAARRTVVACLPALARPDDQFARGVLTPSEYLLYRQMDSRDRVHAVHVARRLLELRPDARRELVRAALLHDVGKSDLPYNPLHRIVAHLHTPAGLPAQPRLSGLRGAWQQRLHHHAYGGQMIRDAGGDAEVARLVERHHHPRGDVEAQLLKDLDDAT